MCLCMKPAAVINACLYSEDHPVLIYSWIYNYISVPEY